MGYKILAKFCQEKEVTEAHKEGILLGMHIMALQTEKWLDNEDHATAYRTDTWDECGFSGWREIYEHTKGFLEAKQPEESEEDFGELLQKNYEKVYSEKYEQPEESDVSDMEVTDDEEGLTWEQLKEEMKTNLNETVSDDNGFEVVDKEDEESGDDEEDFTPYTYENVEYLIAPKYDDPERVVLETEDYHPVGVFEDGKIVFEDNLQVAEHFQRVRESTIPEDEDEAKELLHSFIKDNYKGLNLSFRSTPHRNDLGYPIHHYQALVVFKGDREPRDAHPETWTVPSHQFYFQRDAWRVWPGGKVNRTITLGKNMGEVMKEIEALL